MERNFSLSESEQKLRQLLLDVTDYIGSETSTPRPTLRFTGGWVRDKLLGRTSSDIDIGIDNLTGKQFGDLMKAYLEKNPGKYPGSILGRLALIKENPEKSKHLETVATKIYDLDVDLVNLRKEVYKDDSRNPTMEFGTPQEDALRRDSTVNALFYNLSEDKVEDFTGLGLQDMSSKVIRTPLPAFETFRDDPLRVLRCVRFASNLQYVIDKEAQKCMADLTILSALRAKISRERVGTEIEKMLKGPHPKEALSLINRLGIYNAIFADPSLPEEQHASLKDWHKSYEFLFRLMEKKGQSGDHKYLSNLISSTQETYLAWLLCAIVPWSYGARADDSSSGSKKFPHTTAALAARGGLKVDNETMHLIEDAARNVREISQFVKAFAKETKSQNVPAKRRESEMQRREATGMAIRQWSPKPPRSKWRLSVIYALLADAAGCNTSEELAELTQEYSLWAAYVEESGLQDVDLLKPIMDGNELRQIVGRQPGSWLSGALDFVVQWQLGNPDKTNREDVAQAVAARFKVPD